MVDGTLSLCDACALSCCYCGSNDAPSELVRVDYQEENDVLTKQQVVEILRDHTKLSSVLKAENEVSFE